MNMDGIYLNILSQILKEASPWKEFKETGKEEHVLLIYNK